MSDRAALSRIGGRTVSRRRLITYSLGAGAGLGATALLAACATAPPATPTTQPVAATAPTVPAGSPAPQVTATPAPVAAAASPTTASAATPTSAAAASPTAAASLAPNQQMTWYQAGRGRPYWSPTRDGGIGMYFGELVFGGLLSSDVDGNPVPYAAESWKASDDQLVWSFKLRNDLKFAPTGRAARAIDVKKSFELMVANMQPWYVPTYLFFVKGAADAAKQARQGLQPGDVAKPVDIPGFVAADDLTFEVHLTGPAPALLPYAAAGSLSGWAIGDPEQMANDTVAKRWNEAGGGALGPYMIKSYNDQTIDTTFVPNPYFVLGKPPVLSQITYKFLKEYSTALIAYQNNSADFMFPVAPPDAMHFTQPSDPMHADLHLRPAARFEWWPFNVDKEPFNDINMRKAVALSIDFPKVLAATYGTTAKLAPCIMPYGTYHRDDEFPKYYKYDPAGAQAAFKASKYGGDPNKVPTPQVAIPDPLLSEWAQIIQQMVKDTIGVTLNLVVKSSFTTAELATMNLQYTAWGAATVDPSEWTSLISLQDPQAANYGVPPKELSDGWVNTVNTETNLDKRKAAWFAAEDYIASNYLILPATHQPFSTLEKPWLQGVYAAPNWYFIRLNELAIAQH